MLLQNQELNMPPMRSTLKLKSKQMEFTTKEPESTKEWKTINLS